ncbi:MAG: efflux RND transporter permease subunit [Actinomycetota bacterium]|nr:efflux RND transporter permease subunit [Actinomycetota bacterium]
MTSETEAFRKRPPARHGILGTIVRFALRRRGIIIALAALFLGYSIYTLKSARYDVFPEFAPPEVTIHTEAPGFSPDQAEQIITRPVESAVSGVGGISDITSKSIQGLSVVKIIFKTGTNVYLARQKIAERLSTLTGQLPSGITPEMAPLTSSTGNVLTIGLASPKLSPMQLRTVADWTVRPRLLAAPGVSKVAIFGSQDKQLQIQVRPGRLIKYNLSLEDVMRAAKKATALEGAGFIDGANQRITIRSQGQSLTTQEIAGTVLVHKEGANVTIGDVANVAEAPAPQLGGTLINGKPGILIVVDAQYGANTLQVTKALDKAVAELRPALKAQGITLYPNLFRAASFIDLALHNVDSALILGAVLVVIVLFLYLFNLRTAAISCTAIPLSLLGSIVILEHLSLSLNTMTIGGLAIAIGEVVDDAVIDVENIFRRLRENRLLENPRPVLKVVYEASVEVRSAVVYATFAVVLVFVPVLTMSGVTGRFFAPLGLSYIFAILSSLLVALTVTPALSLIMLGGKKLKGEDPPVVRWTKKHYGKSIYAVERHPKAVIAVAVLLIAAAAVIVPFLSGKLLPELIEGNFIVHVKAVPGTSLKETLRTGKLIEDKVMKLPFVESIAQRAGRAELGEEARGTNASEFDLTLKPLNKSRFDRAKKEIMDIVRDFPGLTSSIDTFLTERISETVSGYRAPVAVNIYGNDLNVLDKEAAQAQAILSGVRGAAGVRLQAPPTSPELLVSLNKAGLARWGFQPAQVLDDVHTAFAGKNVGQVFDGNRVFNVAVMLSPKDRRSITDIGALPLRNSEGTYVTLSQLASLHEMPARFMVLHDGARRVQTITCRVQGRSVSSFVADAQKAISGQLRLPPGTYIDFAGAAQEQAKTTRDLMVHSAIAAIGIIILLSIVTVSYRNLLLILLNLPFALAGGVFMALATGGSLSMGSIVGFVTLFGITLRNSVMLISHYEHLVQVEGLPWGLETAVRGASERLAPILMTASVTALGLLPLAIGSGAPGREIEGPMAQIILGGLATSTALNLLVMPTLTLRYGRFERKNEFEI